MLKTFSINKHSIKTVALKFNVEFFCLSYLLEKNPLPLATRFTSKSTKITDIKAAADLVRTITY